ncbi:hypothetical protein ACFE04_009172 [Oxalis oulophora]
MISSPTNLVLLMIVVSILLCKVNEARAPSLVARRPSPPPTQQPSNSHPKVNFYFNLNCTRSSNNTNNSWHSCDLHPFKRSGSGSSSNDLHDPPCSISFVPDYDFFQPDRLSIKHLIAELLTLKLRYRARASEVQTTGGQTAMWDQRTGRRERVRVGGESGTIVVQQADGIDCGATRGRERLCCNTPTGTGVEQTPTGTETCTGVEQTVIVSLGGDG